jgi:5'-methylthioadenosine phosphorylase
MTAMPEARLAREAGLCYASLAMVTDFDVWHEHEEDVTIEVVKRVLAENIESGRNVILQLACEGLPSCDAGCAHAGISSLTTAPAQVAPEVRKRLSVILDERRS